MTSGYMAYAGSATVSFGTTRYATLPYVGLAAAAAAVSLPYCENRARKMWVKVTGSTLAGIDATCVISFRKNGLVTALNLECLAVGTYSVTADVDIADGDVLDILFFADATSGNIVLIVGIDFLSP
jgi:hypothetical protein